MEGYTKIGRIRPNYTGTWSAETAYTVLEMVKNETGTASYIAKQDVPAGTPLTDEAYWAMVLDAGDVIDAAEKATERANKAADALGIVQTATGSVIAVSDASDMPLKDLRLFGKTTQDGTPTPETPVDLVSVGEGGSVGVSVCGKNILPNKGKTETLNGVTFTPQGDGTILMNGTSTGDVIYSVYSDAPSIIKADGTTYTISFGEEFKKLANDNINKAYMVVGYTIGSKSTYPVFVTDSTTTFSIDEPEAEIINVRVRLYAGVACNNIKIYPQIEAGTVSTSYESFIPAQTLTALTPNGLPGIPVSSGGNYTDANGQQWVCDEIDFGNGKVIKNTVEIVFDGTEEWRAEASGYVCYSNVTGKTGGALSSHFCGNPYTTDKGVWINSARGVLIRYDNIQTAEDFKSYVAEQYIKGTPLTVIAIAFKPTETALTAEEIAAYRALHTNYPNTTVFNDAGADVEVKYVADTKLYIDNKFAALQEAIINA